MLGRTEKSLPCCGVDHQYGHPDAGQLDQQRVTPLLDPSSKGPGPRSAMDTISAWKKERGIDSDLIAKTDPGVAVVLDDQHCWKVSGTNAPVDNGYVLCLETAAGRSAAHYKSFAGAATAFQEVAASVRSGHVNLTDNLDVPSKVPLLAMSKSGFAVVVAHEINGEALKLILAESPIAK